MHDTSVTQRTRWQLTALWAVGVSGAVVLSSAVVLGAAGRVTDPVTTFRLASGTDGVTTAADAVGTNPAPDLLDRWPDLESFRLALATGSLMPRSPALMGTWTEPATLTPITIDDDSVVDERLVSPVADDDVTAPSSDTSTGGHDTQGTRPGGGSDGESGKTITTDAGTVRVAVEGDQVQVVYATPGDGYAVSIEGDGTADVRVELTSKDNRTRIAAGIDDGVPTISVQQDSSSSGQDGSPAAEDTTELDAG